MNKFERKELKNAKKKIKKVMDHLHDMIYSDEYNLTIQQKRKIDRDIQLLTDAVVSIDFVLDKVYL